jgi:Sec-independent protein translocase protein TatA
MFPGVSMSEILVILFVALLALGPQGLTRTARQLGRYKRAAQHAMEDIRKEFRDLNKF